MKKTLSLLSAVIICLTACKKEEKAPTLDQETVGVVAPTITYEYDTDSTGAVQIVVVKVSTTDTTNQLTATVPNDYVLIGGGTSVATSATGAGGVVPVGYYTASFPDTALTTWYGQSSPRPLRNSAITVCAIGLKLAGVTKAQLKANLQIFTGSVAGADSVSVADGYTLIGGGTKLAFTGVSKSILRSRPSGNSWVSTIKDYTVNDSSTMTTYAIGIRDSIPSFGTVEVQQVQEIVNVTNGADNLTFAGMKIYDNGVVACGGGELIAPYNGRWLRGTSFGAKYITTTSGRDVVYTRGGATACYLLRIRKQLN